MAASRGRVPSGLNEVAFVWQPTPSYSDDLVAMPSTATLNKEDT